MEHKVIDWCKPGDAWVGVDFDGTLAEYDHWRGSAHVGAPIPAMVERVGRWLTAGRNVRIFTARAYPFYRPIMPGECMMCVLSEADFDSREFVRAQDSAKAIFAIRAWCQEHLGRELPITCVKDPDMIELWDDRAVQVESNTGRPTGPSRRGLE